jgi:uracil-DNA glycosylase
MITAQNLAQAVPASWHALLAEEFGKPYWYALVDFLNTLQQTDKVIYPQQAHWFTALDATTPENVRVVILGQDPYHGPGQAHGLSFSVPAGVTVPPSLGNIYREIKRDLGFPIPLTGNLLQWAKQGVLLLNTVLTVEQRKAGSHRAQGWENFTDAIIQKLAQHYEHIVFMLWGSFAQGKIQFIDQQRHCILHSPHPSPLSAHRGFIGNGHFSAANHYLAQHGRGEIDWQIK